MSTIKGIGAGAVTAAALAYFFDPDNGNRRRSVARDRIEAFSRARVRDASGAAQTTATRLRSIATGAVHQARQTAQSERPTPNDAELAHRVETEIFRSPQVPNGSVTVNAEVAIVYLRGQVETQEQIEALVAAARAVDGVRGVENLLHLPGQPARTKGETQEETRLRVER